MTQKFYKYEKYNALYKKTCMFYAETSFPRELRRDLIYLIYFKLFTNHIKF